MAALTNPINAQNMVNRYADYVPTTANSGIVWGTNALPFAEFPSSYFGGTTSGRPIGLTAPDATYRGTLIYASNETTAKTAPMVYHALYNETYYYTNIRNLRARKVIISTIGANSVAYDQTQKSYLNTSYWQSLGAVSSNNIDIGQRITASGLEGFFGILRSRWQTLAANAVAVDVNVCHISCHGSCHGSRIRR
jgi:hypothetical protein